MIQIKHRSTGRVIKEVDATSLMNADLRNANLQRADLQNADLLGANLQGANLWNADLEGADLEGADLLGANLRDANLRDANLRDVDLRDADLQNADLHSADIRWVLGDGERIISIQNCYDIVIAPEYNVIAIGCEKHFISEWMNFSDDEINKMDKHALEWWKKWKPIIKNIVEN